MTKFWIKIKSYWKFHSIHFAKSSIHQRWYPPPAMLPLYWVTILVEKKQRMYSLIHFPQNQPGKHKQRAWQILRVQTVLPSADGKGQSSPASKQCPRAKTSSAITLRSRMGCLNLTLMSTCFVDASWSLGTMVSKVLSVLCITQFRVLCFLGFYYSCRSSINMTVSDLKSWDIVHCNRVQAWDDKTGPGSRTNINSFHGYKQLPHGQLKKYRAQQNCFRSNMQSKKQVFRLHKTHSTWQIGMWHGLTWEALELVGWVLHECIEERDLKHGHTGATMVEQVDFVWTEDGRTAPARNISHWNLQR